MKRIIATCVSGLLASTAAVTAWALDTSMDEANREHLKRAFPNLSITDFSETPVPGVYEVQAGEQIFYFSPQGYLFFGELWSKDGHNLTAESREALLSKAVGALPLDKAVRIGSGPHQVIEFTDPDCPHCRRVEKHLDGRADVTRYVFFYPLETLHPQARAKAQLILCAADREQALREVFAGRYDHQPIRLAAPCDADALLEEHLELARRLGVRGTPVLWVNGRQVSGADLARIDALLHRP